MAKRSSAQSGGKADALLEAHVAFIIEQISGKALQPWVEAQIDAALEDASKLRLTDVVSAATVKATIKSYAVDMELGAGIPELVGDIARALYGHEMHTQTRLADLLPDQQLHAFIDKLLDMRELRTRLIKESVGNPLYQALAADIVFFSVRGYLAQNHMGDKIPGARSVMKLGKSVLSRTSPRLEGAIEANLKKYIRGNITSILKESERFLLNNVDDNKLRSGALNIWDDVKRIRVSQLLDYLNSRDVEEFFVLGYEYWRDLRKTGYYSALINAGVDVFFKKYGKTSLLDLLAEVGIERGMLVREALRYAPPVIEGLQKKKLLDPLIRRNLEGFYHSRQAATILAAD